MLFSKRILYWRKARTNKEERYKLVFMMDESEGWSLLCYDHEKEEELIARSNRDEARREGFKEGKELGLKKGIERGKREIAKTMKSKEISTQLIMEITGLDEKMISK